VKLSYRNKYIIIFLIITITTIGIILFLTANKKTLEALITLKLTDLFYLLLLWLISLLFDGLSIYFLVKASDKNITAHFVLSTSSTPKLVDIQNIITYPNPARGETITIQITDVECMINIKIIDVNGRLVFSKNEHIDGNRPVQLPIKEIGNGIYILSISSDHFRHHQKLIIG